MWPRLGIFVMTRGGPQRELYLDRLLRNLALERNRYEGKVEVLLVEQGGPRTPGLQRIVNRYRLRELFLEQNIGRALGQARAVAELAGTTDMILRMDDDARPVTSYFLSTGVEALTCKNEGFVNAFPVGTPNNLGGCRKIREHEIARGTRTGRVFTFRPVARCGGLARIACTDVWRSIEWQKDIGPDAAPIESLQLQVECGRLGIPIYYCENEWIVEHQDSTLGQKWRRENEYS